MDSFDFGASFERATDTFFEWLPNLVGALVILLIGWIVARIAKALLVKLGEALHVDEQLDRGRVGEYVSQVTESPNRAIGTLGFWLVMLGALSLAVTTLGVEALTAFVASIYGYLPHVIAALAIFLVAAAVAGAVSAFATKVMGDTPTGKVVATVAPILIMTIASFMILTELMIAEEIVLITYTALVGAVALAAALAFGLGGRRAAAELLDTASNAVKDNAGQVKRDLDTGRRRTERRFQRSDTAQEARETVTSSAPNGSNGASTN